MVVKTERENQCHVETDSLLTSLSGIHVCCRFSGGIFSADVRWQGGTRPVCWSAGCEVFTGQVSSNTVCHSTRCAHPFVFFPVAVVSFYVFSALTLLVGWQEGHPACKYPHWQSPTVFLRKTNGTWPNLE